MSGRTGIGGEGDAGGFYLRVKILKGTCTLLCLTAPRLSSLPIQQGGRQDAGVVPFAVVNIVSDGLLDLLQEGIYLFVSCLSYQACSDLFMGH